MKVFVIKWGGRSFIKWYGGDLFPNIATLYKIWRLSLKDQFGKLHTMTSLQSAARYEKAKSISNKVTIKNSSVCVAAGLKNACGRADRKIVGFLKSVTIYFKITNCFSQIFSHISTPENQQKMWCGQVTQIETLFDGRLSTFWVK